MLAHAAVKTPLSCAMTVGAVCSGSSRRPWSPALVAGGLAEGAGLSPALMRRKVAVDVVELPAPVMEPGRGLSGVETSYILAHHALDECGECTNHRRRSGWCWHGSPAL